MMRDGKRGVQKPGILVKTSWARVRSRATAFFRVLSLGRRQRRVLFLKASSFLKREVAVETETVAIDMKRRAFLKYVLFGGALFFAGKYLGPFMNMIRGDVVLSEKTFENFKITETGRQLKVSDNDGADLLIIDKEEF